MAQSVIGALRVNLGLDSAQFERGAKRAQKTTDRIAQQMRRLAAVGAAAFTAISASAIAGARDIDASAKAARRLGASIGGFEALKLAADEAGVPISALPNEIQNVNRELANIGTSGNADRALKRLGLSFSELQGLDVDEKIAVIADRVKELGLSSGEATAVLRDLGVRNREMVLLLQQGGDAIRQARQDVEDYGLALSGPAAAAVEQANDRIGRLSIVARVFGQQMGFAVVPALGRFAEKITDSVREGGQLRTVINVLANVGRGFAKVIDLVSENLDFLIDLFKIFVGAKIVTFVASVGRAMIVLARSIRATGLVMVAFTSITRAKITAIALLGAVIAKATGTYETFVGFIKETSQALLNALPPEIGNGINALGDKISGLGESLLETGRIAENDFFNAEQDAANAADSFGSASRGASKGVEELAKKTEQAAISGEAFGNRFGDMVADVVTGSRKIGDVLRDLGNQILRSSISGIFGNIFQGLGFGGFGIPSFANGTRSAPGGLSRINERGGELAILPGGTQVIPHDLSKEMLAGGARAGGTATIRLIAPEGFTVQQEGRVQGIALQVTGAALEQYDKETLPGSVERVQRDPLRVG